MSLEAPSYMNTRDSLLHQNIKDIVNKAITLKDGDEVLDIAEILPIFNMSYGTKLLVRMCYKDFYRLVTTAAEKVYHSHYQWSRSGIRICGTPGIGKTYFFIYLLLCLIRDSKYSILVNLQETRYVLFPGKSNASHIIEKHEIQALFFKEKVIFIFDPSTYKLGTPPPTFQGFLVYISSPSSRMKINKDLQLTEYFMCPWSLEELGKALVIYKEHLPLDFQKVKEIFAFWGGVPRIVFSSFDTEYFLQRLRKVLLQPIQVKKLLQRCTASSSVLDDYFTEDNQWLSYIYPSADYRSFQFCFPSPYMYEMFIEANESVNDSVVSTHLHKIMDGDTKLGLIYEDRVINKIFRIGERIKLSEGIDIEIKQRVKFPFNGSAVHNLTPHTLYIPTEKNFSSIDMVFPPYMFQITISENHSIVAKGVVKIKEMFPSIHYWVLVWVVPERRAGKYEQRQLKVSLFNEKLVYVVDDSFLEEGNIHDDSSTDSDDSSPPRKSLKRSISCIY